MKGSNHTSQIFKIAFFLIIVIFQLHSSSAQTTPSYIDSQNKHTLLNLQNYLDSAYNNLKRLTSLSSEIAYEQGILESKAIEGIIQSDYRIDSSATRKLFNVYPKISSINNFYHPYIYWSLGRSFYRSGLNERADFYFDKSLATDIDSVVVKLNILIDWGSFLAGKGYYNKALEKFERAYKIALQEKQDTYLPDIYRYLSNIHNRMNDFEHAKEFASKSIDYYQKHKDYRKLADGYLTYAGISIFQEQYDSAKIYYKQALKYYNDAEDNLGPVYAYVNMSDAYLALEEYDSCLYYLQQSRSGLIALSGGRKRLAEAIDMQLTSFYLETKRYDEAYNFANLVLKNSTETGVLETKRNAYKILYTIKKHKKQADSALYFFEQYKAYADSILNDDTERQYAKQKFAIETIEKEHDITKLESKIVQAAYKNTTLTIGIIVILVFVILITAFYRSMASNAKIKQKNAELEKENIREKLKRREQELTDYTLSMMKKNKFVEDLTATLHDAKNQFSNTEPTSVLNKVINTINFNKNTERDWDNFNKHFGSVHQDFFTKIKNEYQSLSSNDLRHAALIKMNMSLKESAEIIGVDVESVKKAHYRMRKKMNLDPEVKLYDAITLV